jgi:Amt family ammonium transporter
VKPPKLARAALLLALVALFVLALPAIASAADAPAVPAATRADLNWVWTMFAGILVVLMQVGFMFLEIGFARGKNVGTIVAKILVNFSIAAVVFWACGFALGFGGGGRIFGNTGFFLHIGQHLSSTAPSANLVDAGASQTANGGTLTYFFFQFAFAAVSLAIVWGSTLERIKFIVYPIYAVVFSAIIYPLVAHALFAGAFTPFGHGVQDFAGSSVVHLCGAVAAFAAVLILGPRRGKFGPDGKPRPIPGHNMPLFGLAVLILWVGWFGFNPGSTLSAEGSSFALVAVVTNLAAAGGVLGAMLMSQLLQKTLDVGMIGNGAIAALVAITAPSGFVDPFAGLIIGFVAGVIVVPSVMMIDKKIDDPVGVLSAHGIAGIWGTLSCGLFAVPRLVTTWKSNSDPGLFYGGGFTQLAIQLIAVLAVFAYVFTLSIITFWLINKTVGMRVTAEEEDAGLDISEHGMYGYPEQFIPQAELGGYGLSPVLTSAAAVGGEGA